MKRKNILIILISILFSVSCEKEIIIEKEVYQTYRWKSHPAFQYENSILLNSINVDSSFIAFSGLNIFNKIGSNQNTYSGAYDSIFKDNFVKQYHNDIKAIDSKIPITSQITIAYNEGAEPHFGRVNFISTTEYGSSNSYATYLYMGEIDTTFIGFSFDRPTYNDCVAINDNGQVLIPYKSLTNGEFQLRFLLVTTRQTGNSVFPTEILGTEIIKIQDKFENSVTYLQSVNNLFFVTTDSKTFVINSEGYFMEKFDDYHLYNIIPENDILYAFGYDFTLNQHEFLHSTNNGMVWNKISTSENEIANINFSIIRNKIIGYWKSQIWEFTLSENEYKAVELDNDGLAGKIITSIAEYKDKVYVTTHSGLFYQDIDDLFKIKEESN